MRNEVADRPFPRRGGQPDPALDQFHPRNRERQIILPICTVGDMDFPNN
jgi:hypothetical protein